VTRGGQVLLGVTTFVLAVVAVLLALVGAFLTPDERHLWVIPVPVGVLIAVIGNLVLGIGGAWGTQTRFAPAVTGFVWFVVAFIFSSRGPGGDEIVSGRGWMGVAYLFLGAIAAAAAIGVGPIGLRRRPPASSLGADLRR